ncbi:hypothetical protein K2Z84_05415 [Candidatus Binatia bacterium]|nr:hypothetical protein [Candidatus Binatia bacterium]
MAQINVVGAIAAFTPMLKALVLEFEQEGKSGAEKHAAVAEAAEAAYKALQDSGAVKELQGVPWELVAPAVVGITNVSVGIIGSIVRGLNKLFGKVWGLFGLGS